MREIREIAIQDAIALVGATVEKLRGSGGRVCDTGIVFGAMQSWDHGIYLACETEGRMFVAFVDPAEGWYVRVLTEPPE